LGSAARMYQNVEVYTPWLSVAILLILRYSQASFTMNKPILSETYRQKRKICESKKISDLAEGHQ